MNLGDKLKSLRDKYDLTQKQVSEILGVSKSNVSKYESNDVEPNIETLKRYAKHFNVSVDYLLGTDLPEKPDQTQSNSVITSNSPQNKYFFFFFDKENTLRDVFTKRIRTAILDMGLSEEEFKDEISFGEEKASSFLDGSSDPTADDLIELSRFLNTSIDYLLGQIPKIGTIEKKLLNAFIHLDTDNQDIIIGKTKELLKEQRHESVAAETMPLKKTGTDDPKK